ncbi:uncharacterized protein (TIGR02271 family) [Geodermatophilus tzadiensis]|uniref:Uncharacterized protein (TIGR02271 family) n=1 Tax=Geodermatophilus tzadiensis TaxID=1137988 RepID=A0A2T0TF93_9ACTN|nr:PRC and DUF2382 domain-containing protein [Geodermatophilus tzadiensis]PRY44335.1 uncharacterized protein (TIGR02271 family) [Geodermatophilus tzadiensis]
MISEQQIQQVIGGTAVDRDGDKLGKIGEVYLDDETGRPEWATVHTGLFGTKETFVPLAQAEVSGETIRFPYEKAKVKDAPKIDTDGHLSPQEEQELYRYYGLGSGTGTQTTQTTTHAAAGTVGTGTAGTRTDRDGDGVYDDVQDRAVGRDTSGPTTDSAMTRSEEHLEVGTQRVEAGRARLRKYVTTERETATVPVSHEEVRVEREPITDANVGNALDGPTISEEEHEVTLHAERPVVSTEATPVERVRLDTETVTGQETVSGDVRKEQIDVDTDGVDPRR